MNRIIFVGIFILVAVLTAFTIRDTMQSVPPESTNTHATTTISGTPTRKMAKFSQNPFGVSFSYPADWKGPEVYTYENGFRYEIGTDTVYPYGTDPTERIHTKKNNYYIVVQYDKKPANITATEFRKTQVHLKQYDTLVKLNPGETIEDTRSLVIKVRNINYAGVTGVEYISTLSKSAQTEMSYTREAVLFDTDMNVLSIRGYADDVEVTDNTNWKKDYEAIDAKYLSEFTVLTNSVAF